MIAQSNPKLNQLLSVLPPEEWSRIAPELVLVDMPLGHVVYESGDQPEYVYRRAIFSALRSKCWTGRASNAASVNAMPWSNGSSTVSCPRFRRSDR